MASPRGAGLHVGDTFVAQALQRSNMRAVRPLPLHAQDELTISSSSSTATRSRATASAAASA